MQRVSEAQRRPEAPEPCRGSRRRPEAPEPCRGFQRHPEATERGSQRRAEAPEPCRGSELFGGSEVVGISPVPRVEGHK
eukprot:8952629-Pyramimonas_sp.AAC.1